MAGSIEIIHLFQSILINLCNQGAQIEKQSLESGLNIT